MYINTTCSDYNNLSCMHVFRFDHWFWVANSKCVLPMRKTISPTLNILWLKCFYLGLSPWVFASPYMLVRHFGKCFCYYLGAQSDSKFPDSLALTIFPPPLTQLLLGCGSVDYTTLWFD